MRIREDMYDHEAWAILAREAGFEPIHTESSARRAFRFCAERIERLTAERDEARARAEGLAEALTRVLMWAPRSTEAACEQDYEVARAALAALPAPPEEDDDGK